MLSVVQIREYREHVCFQAEFDGGQRDCFRPVRSFCRVRFRPIADLSAALAALRFSMRYREYDFADNVPREHGRQDHYQCERDHEKHSETDFRRTQDSRSGPAYGSYDHSTQERSEVCLTKPASIYADEARSYQANLAMQERAECTCTIYCCSMDKGVFEVMEEFHLTPSICRSAGEGPLLRYRVNWLLAMPMSWVCKLRGTVCLPHSWHGKPRQDPHNKPHLAPRRQLHPVLSLSHHLGLHIVGRRALRTWDRQVLHTLAPRALQTPHRRARHTMGHLALRSRHRLETWNTIHLLL